MAINEWAFGHTVRHCKDLGLSLTEDGVREIVGIYEAHRNKHPEPDLLGYKLRNQITSGLNAAIQSTQNREVSKLLNESIEAMKNIPWKE